MPTRVDVICVKRLHMRQQRFGQAAPSDIASARATIRPGACRFPHSVRSRMGRGSGFDQMRFTPVNRTKPFIIPARLLRYATGW
jgi:hypothetical protein